MHPLTYLTLSPTHSHAPTHPPTPPHATTKIEDVLVFRPDADTNRPAYAVVLDHTRKLVVWGFRGTTNLEVCGAAACVCVCVLLVARGALDAQSPPPPPPNTHPSPTHPRTHRTCPPNKHPPPQPTHPHVQKPRTC